MTFALAGHCFACTIDDVSLARYWRKLFRHLAIKNKPDGNIVELAIINEDKENGRAFIGCKNGFRAENGLALFVAGDNLWKGAAQNAIQIAELLVRRAVASGT